VAFFVLLLLLADSTPPAASAVPLIGHLLLLFLLPVVNFLISTSFVSDYYVIDILFLIYV